MALRGITLDAEIEPDLRLRGSRDQLSTLISILEQRGGQPLYDKNVVVKTTGGLKLSQQSANLAVIMAMVSSASGGIRTQGGDCPLSCGSF